MNSFFHLPFLFICLCFFFVSCTKIKENIITNTNTGTSTGVNIYVAGNIGNNPVLWKNGTADTLLNSTNTAFADQIIVSGNDIYVAGQIREFYGIQDVYWKNGIQINIGNPDSSFANNSISLIGNNVYYSSSYGLAYENGAIIPLQGLGSYDVGYTFAVGNDIYFAGNDSVGDVVYWKNGQLNVLLKSVYSPGFGWTQPGVVSCMYVSGNHVCVGGNFNVNLIPIYWKNGIADTLKPSSGSVFVQNLTSIFVSGNDVYATANALGDINHSPQDQNVNSIPAYWKNGVEHELPFDGAGEEGTANSIFVSGSDVYVAGSTSSGAVYWKNGIETILSQSGSAKSIYVQ